jgi:gamma-glutamyltranspeptidase
VTSAITANTDAVASAGAEILTQGGNAVDAIAAACVADPCNIGIGGYGGFLTVRTPDGGSRCVDFDTWAPAAIPAKALRRRLDPQGGGRGRAVPRRV